jgi:hypothetical protein
MRIQDEYLTSFRKDLRREASGSNELGSAAALGVPVLLHTRDVIGPLFQPECRLVTVTLPQRWHK